jgi:hypothetical protein
MKKYARCILASIFIITGCGQKDTRKDDTPGDSKILQGKSTEISYTRSKGNLAEQLFDELKSSSPQLKDLDDGIGSLSGRAEEQQDEFEKYENKPVSYYAAANNLAATISDSLLRNRIIELIASGKKNYEKNSAPIKNLLSQIAQNRLSLNDGYTAVKIVMTLPVIEKYQKDNLPEPDAYRLLLHDQERVLQELDSMVTEH